MHLVIDNFCFNSNQPSLSSESSERSVNVKLGGAKPSSGFSAAGESLRHRPSGSARGVRVNRMAGPDCQGLPNVEELKVRATSPRLFESP